jgi:sugar lactone lactonase YvrE
VRLVRAVALAVVCAVGLGVVSSPLALSGQQKGGEDETGPYDAVADWPQPWARPGYIWGSQPGVFAESPDRIFLAVRGELKAPETPGRGFNGIWGSTGERATVPKPELRNCLLVVNADGKVIEAWTQWDHLFEGGTGPHKVKISPYDPERHVWVVNDALQEIYEFSNDGKQLVRTLGERGVAGEDERHFNLPQDLTFLPDGSILIADGLRNSRIVKLDEHGTFIKAWGTRGTGPGQFSGLHGIEADSGGRVYVADRGNRRIQVFDANGTHLDTWPNIRFPNHIVVTADRKHVWVSDGDNARLLQYDADGHLQYWWGVYGTRPGTFWEMHQFSIDSAGNLYAADSFGGRTTKLRPRADADKSRLVGPPQALMTKAAR